MTPFLWFDRQAEEAARRCASLLPDSHVDHVTGPPAGRLRMPASVA